ncbi:MAG: hypothetical protein ABIA37_01640 [Candidatus Woesearchaeota archaeon]
MKRIRKKYGEYQSKTCPFCERRATHKSEQGLDVCHLHLKQNLEEIKCLCGEWLEIMQGKFGPFFRCRNCGCMNLKKVKEIQQITGQKKESYIKVESRPELSIKKETIKKERKEITITTNDVEYFS